MDSPLLCWCAEITIAWKDIHQESLGTRCHDGCRWGDSQKTGTTNATNTMTILFCSESMLLHKIWEKNRVSPIYMSYCSDGLGVGNPRNSFRQSLNVGQHVTTLHLCWRSCDILFHFEWIWTNDLRFRCIWHLPRVTISIAEPFDPSSTESVKGLMRQWDIRVSSSA